MSRKKIAYQGLPGSWSEIACREACPEHEPLSCSSFLDAFIAVEKGAADLALIPVDNTIAGRVADIHHLLPQYHLHFVKEHYLPIRLCLLGVPGAAVGDVKKVFSHVHALPQCRELIKKMRWEPVVYGDTAGSARRVAEMNDPACAAIASQQAAKLYGLKVLKKNIADRSDNITRFLALSRRGPLAVRRVKGRKYKTGFIFRVRNLPAALYKALGGFATNGVNMLKLESYMPDGGFASTLFFCEVAGHQDDAGLARAIEELRFFSDEVRILGSYPAASLRGRK